MVWKSKVPPRVAFFSWTATLDKILTTDNLWKKAYCSAIVVLYVQTVGDITQSNNGRTRLIEKIKESRYLGGTILFSLDNICLYTFVAKGLSQICF